MNKASIAVIGLFLALYVAPLGMRPLVAPDETRYGEIPREMLASGDWIVPRLNGLRYFEKPILGYWLNALSIAAFGENAFSIRFPSAVAAGLSALLLFALLRRFAGGYPAGIVGAAVQLTAVLGFVIGIAGVLDSALSCFLTSVMVCFFFAFMEADRRKRAGYLALCGLACGLAFLTKGFLAFAVPVVSIVPFLIWERRWKSMFALALIPAAVAVLVSLPWGILIHLRESDFWR